MNTVTIAGKTVEVDEEGFLWRPSDWNKEVATAMAKADGIELTPAHWEVINLVREHYDQYQASPNVRVLLWAIARKYAVAKKPSPPDKGFSNFLYKLFPRWYEQEAQTQAWQEALQEASKRYSMKYLCELFPRGPAKQAYRYAGLPKPTGCP